MILLLTDKNVCPTSSIFKVNHHGWLCRGHPPPNMKIFGSRSGYAAIFKINVGFSMIKTLTKLSKKHPIIKDELAHAHLDGGFTDKAFKEIRKFLKQYPDSVTGLIVCALAHEEVGEEDKAEILYRQVLELEPRNIRAITRMAALESDNAEESDYWKKSLAAIDPLSPWIQAVEVPAKGSKDIDYPVRDREYLEAESAVAPVPEAEISEVVPEDRASNEYYEEIDKTADAETGEAIAEEMPETEIPEPVEEELDDSGTEETVMSQPPAEEEAAELPAEETDAGDRLAEEFEMPEIDVKYQEPDDLSDKLLSDLAALEGEEIPIDAEPVSVLEEAETESNTEDETPVDIEAETTEIDVDVESGAPVEDTTETETEPEPEAEPKIEAEQEIEESPAVIDGTDTPAEEDGAEITAPADSIESKQSASDGYPEQTDEAEGEEYAPSADEISELQKVYMEIDEHSNSKPINDEEQAARDIQTITLAEIYAKQGSYTKALVIYNALPEDVKIQYMDEIQRLESLVNQNPDEDKN